MRTTVAPDNPFGYDRYGFAWAHVPTNDQPHLDFGCANGSFLASLRSKGKQRLAGVDASREAVEAARLAHPDLEIVRLAPGSPLPFDDGTFGSATILDVLEHVGDKRMLLAELARVLADSGVLIVTVPRRYALSAFDWGNLKFRFPRLHRSYYSLAHSREAYERRYAAHNDGLSGDIDVTSGEAWHHHFTVDELRDLLGEAGFRVAQTDGSGFFYRLWDLPLYGLGLARLPGGGRVATYLWQSDGRAFESMNLFCVACKT